jgi:hypothetical protein
MTHEEILKGLYDNTLIGNAPEVKDLTNKGLEENLEPESMLYDALIPSLEEVGARFERGDFFVPEMLIAARAMQGALDILRPLLAETGAKQVGTYVMGTVKGDVHDIGKNLVNIMLEGAGFTSQCPSGRTPPQGPLRSSFGQFIGQVSPVECRTHWPHIWQPKIGFLTAASTRASGPIRRVRPSASSRSGPSPCGQPSTRLLRSRRRRPCRRTPA